LTHLAIISLSPSLKKKCFSSDVLLLDLKKFTWARTETRIASKVIFILIVWRKVKNTQRSCSFIYLETYVFIKVNIVGCIGSDNKMMIGWINIEDTMSRYIFCTESALSVFRLIMDQSLVRISDEIWQHHFVHKWSRLEQIRCESVRMSLTRKLLRAMNKTIVRIRRKIIVPKVLERAEIVRSVGSRSI